MRLAHDVRMGDPEDSMSLGDGVLEQLDGVIQSSHRSRDPFDVSGLPRQTFYATTHLCAECQQKQIAEAVRAAEKRAKVARAMQDAAAQAAAALRAQRSDRIASMLNGSPHTSCRPTGPLRKIISRC
jgi:hypothetical protein